MLDQHVNVAQLWGPACEAARKGEKWGQRKKSVSDAVERYLKLVSEARAQSSCIGWQGKDR